MRFLPQEKMAQAIVYGATGDDVDEGDDTTGTVADQVKSAGACGLRVLKRSNARSAENVLVRKRVRPRVALFAD